MTAVPATLLQALATEPTCTRVSLDVARLVDDYVGPQCAWLLVGLHPTPHGADCDRLHNRGACAVPGCPNTMCCLCASNGWHPSRCGLCTSMSVCPAHVDGGALPCREHGTAPVCAQDLTSPARFCCAGIVRTHLCAKCLARGVDNNWFYPYLEHCGFCQRLLCRGCRARNAEDRSQYPAFVSICGTCRGHAALVPRRVMPARRCKARHQSSERRLSVLVVSTRKGKRKTRTE